MNLFDFDADYGAAYEQTARQMAPARETSYALALLLLENALPEQANLLIVGTGTGMELATFGQQQPGWSFTGVEPAEQMIALTQQKLLQCGLQERVKLYQGYTDSLPLIPAFDAATLIYVLHFLADDAAKLSLLKEVRRRLKPGGYLILGVHQALAEPDSQDLFMATWKGFMTQQGMTAVEMSRFMERCQTGLFPITAERTAALVEAAGFEPPVKFFQALFQGLWISRSPED